MWLGLLMLLDSAKFSDRRVHASPRDLHGGRDDKSIRRQGKWEFHAIKAHLRNKTRSCMHQSMACFSLLLSLGGRSNLPARPIPYPVKKILFRAYGKLKTPMQRCTRSCLLPTSFICHLGARWGKIDSYRGRCWAQRQNPKPLKDSSWEERVSITYKAA